MEANSYLFTMPNSRQTAETYPFSPHSSFQEFAKQKFFIANCSILTDEPVLGAIISLAPTKNFHGMSRNLFPSNVPVGATFEN
jgi:hypothetical protein